MWKLLESPTKEDLNEIRYLKRARLYADEDIEEWIIEALRGRGVNIKSARELGYTHKPDSFHAAFAFKEKRFLLTKNAKHYLNDRKLPLHRTWGVLILDATPSNTADMIASMRQLLDLIIPLGEIFEGTKIKLSSEEISIRSRHRDTGKMTTVRFKLINDEYHQWID